MPVCKGGRRRSSAATLNPPPPTGWESRIPRFAPYSGRPYSGFWAGFGTWLSLFSAFLCVLDQTMPCNACHSKNAKTVDLLPLGKADRFTLRQKHPDCAEYWVICELCVRQACPNPPFLVQSSSHLQLQLVLQLPPLLLIVRQVLPPPLLLMLWVVLRVLCHASE